MSKEENYGGLFKGGVKPGEYKGITPKHDVVKRAGETICWKDYIAANNVDVEIYDTLRKYGSIKESQFDYQAVAGDFDDLNDLHETLAKQIKAKEMFDELPLETKAIFNNDINNFIDNGEAYCQELIRKDQEKAAAEKAAAEKAAADNAELSKEQRTKYIAELKKELGLELGE